MIYYEQILQNALIGTIMFIFAELIFRLGQVIRECLYYSKHYDYNDRIWTIFKLAFTFTHSSVVFILIIISILLVNFRDCELLILLSNNLHLPVIWWIFRLVQFEHSAINYAEWIRSDHGLDYATGMAANYFHGYINLVMPSHDQQKGIRERMEIYASKNKATFAVNHLIILVPKSLHFKPIIESEIMERVQPLEGVIKNRAGVLRPFKNDVYRFTKPIKGKFMYVAVEGATPLLSYFEALNFQLTSTWQMKAMQREIMLKFSRYLKEIVRKWPDTQKECEIVFYDDYTENGQQQDVGKILLAHIENIWN